MRVAIVHSTMNTAGGGELVCLSFIEVLRKLGYEIHLFTIDRTDWSLLEGRFGGVVRPDEEIFLLPFKVRGLGLYRGIIVSYAFRRRLRGYDLVINTHGDFAPMRMDLIYVYFPRLLLPEFMERYARDLFWRAYFLPFRKVQERGLDHLRSSETKIVVLSRYVGRMLEELGLGYHKILYPPTPAGDLRKRALNAIEEDKENIVVTVSRFSEEKNLRLIPEIASLVDVDAEFVVIGGLRGSRGRRILEDVRKRAEELGVGGSVRLLANVGKGTRDDILLRAKVYLHTMPNEHFGISVIEGMAAGCVPVVHRSGGPWIDILEEGEGIYGFSYEDPEEAAEKISEILSNDELRATLARRAIERSKYFEKEEFEKRAIKLLESI